MNVSRLVTDDVKSQQPGTGVERVVRIQNTIEQITAKTTIEDAQKLLDEIKSSTVEINKNPGNLVTSETRSEVLLNNLYSALDQATYGNNFQIYLGKNGLISKALDVTKSSEFRYFDSVANEITQYNSGAVRSTVTTVRIDNSNFELKPTVGDGNCGVDSLDNGLRNLGVQMPSTTAEVREEIAKRCDGARQLMALLDKKTANDIDTVKDQALRLLESCYRDFDSFKQFHCSKEHENQKNSLPNHAYDDSFLTLLNGSNSWEEFTTKFNNDIASANLHLVLNKVVSQMSLHFDGDFSLLKGSSRNITADEYGKTIKSEGSKVWLDYQEIKVYLHSLGFDFKRSVDFTEPKGCIFEFENSAKQKVHLFLNNIQLANKNQLIAQSDRSNHWQYLIPKQ